jgi:hypothetical protein
MLPPLPLIFIAAQMIHNFTFLCQQRISALRIHYGYINRPYYLGVWLDCKLSFQTIKHLQYKIKSRVGFLFRNKASFTHAAKLTLVKLTILPILDFGDVIYKIASNTLLSELDAVYHSAIRFVTKSPHTSHWPSLHANENLFSTSLPD